MDKILNVPQDALLNVLYELEVEDILCLERTCTHLHRLIAFGARHLWFVKLKELDQSCAPDIPPHVNISDLSCTELRDVIVRAVRVYCLMMKGASRTAAYTLRRAIVPVRPDRKFHGKSHLIRFVKIAPGGRYLFMCWSSNVGDEEFCILDLEDGDSRIWSYDPATGHENECRVVVEDCDFDICQDNSITLALITFVESEEGDVTSLSQVFRLSPTSESGAAFQGLLIHSIQNQGQGWDMVMCVVSGKFAVFINPRNFIIVVNWKEGRMTKLRCFEMRSSMHPRIWHDHLFYTNYTVPSSLWAISLVNAMSFSTALSSEMQIHDIRDLDQSHLQIEGARDEDGFMLSEPCWIRYSIYDCSQQGSSQRAMFSLIVGLPNGCLVAIRAEFDPSKSVSAKWTLFKIAQTSYSDANPFASVKSELSRAGRLLMYGKRHACSVSDAQGLRQSIFQREYSFAVVDRQGNPVESGIEFGITEPSNNKAVGIREPTLEGYIEEYSGALVGLGARGSGKDSIELYYPE